MNPTGKGMFIWKLKNCANGDMQIMASMARDAGFSWVTIKTVDGLVNFNQGAGPEWAQPNLLPEAVGALRAVGIKVYGWGYEYGTDWLGRSLAAGEAKLAAENIKRFSFDGYFIDVEKEYKKNGSAANADIFMHALRASCPGTPLGLCSYRFPSLHPEIPWSNFLQHCDFHAPQVYWLKATNSGAQLRQSVRELTALRNLPIIPVGCAYFDTGYQWQPTVGELNEFDQTAHELNLPGITWWEWEENKHGAQYIAPFWQAISAHNWGQPNPPPPPVIDWDHAITAWARSKDYMGPEPG